MKYTAGKDDEGVLLRTYIRSRLGYSRAALSALKAKENGITVNGAPVTVRYVLKEGDVLTLLSEDEAGSPGVEPCDEKCAVLYEDEYILAADKPPFIPCHPVRDYQSGTLASMVLSYLGDRPTVFRCVTRLDRDTSGVVIVAKDRLTSSKLCGMIEKGEIDKTYTAICEKSQNYTEYILENSGEILYNIRMKEGSFMEREAVTDLSAPYSSALPGASGERSSEGRRAVTKYEVLSSSGKYRLIEAKPLTGRTHQIRVHMSSAGFPVTGDTLYGTPSPLINRQALHCSKTEFIHPITGETVSISSLLPDDMKRAAASAGLVLPGRLAEKRRI